MIRNDKITNDPIFMIVFASDAPLPNTFFDLFNTAVSLSPQRIVCVNLLPSKLAITSGVVIACGDGIASIIYTLLSHRYGARTAKIEIDTTDMGCH